MRTRLSLGLVWLVVVWALAAEPGATAATTSRVEPRQALACVDSGWHRLPNDGLTRADLGAVGDGETLIVTRTIYPKHGPEYSAISHFDGDRWESGPAFPTRMLVEELLTDDAGTVWAFGRGTATKQAAIARLVAGTWVAQPLPATDATRSWFTHAASVSATDIWASGEARGGASTGILMHWDGAVWTSVAYPVYGIGHLAAASGVLWAITSGGAIQSWNGATWDSLPNRSSDDETDFLTAAGSVLWGIGMHQTGGPDIDDLKHAPVASSWDGSDWTAHDPPKPGPDSWVDGAMSTSDGQVWVYGGQGRRSIIYPDNTYVARWNGSSWSTETAPNPRGFASYDDGDVQGGIAMLVGGHFYVGQGKVHSYPIVATACI